MTEKEFISHKFINYMEKKDPDDIEVNEFNKIISHETKQNFTNKYEIINYILKDLLDQKIKAINKLKGKDINFQNKLILFSDDHFRFLDNHPKKSNLLIKISFISKYNNKITAIKSYINNFKSIFTQLIKKEVEKEKVRNVDTNVIVDAILYTLHGVTMQLKYEKSYNYARAKKELVNFIYLGLNK